MESLAVLVAILFLIAIFAGPFAIAISSPRLKYRMSSKQGFIWMILRILRQLLHFVATTLGFFIGSQLIGLAVSAGKLIGVFAVVTSYIALRREYFPDFYVTRSLFTRLNIPSFSQLKNQKNEEPPVFSADGTEIIRAKKSKRFGRTSGRDGHGPAGQH
jgi:hypothetical protein